MKGLLIDLMSRNCTKAGTRATLAAFDHFDRVSQIRAKRVMPRGASRHRQNPNASQVDPGVGRSPAVSGTTDMCWFTADGSLMRLQPWHEARYSPQ